MHHKQNGGITVLQVQIIKSLANEFEVKKDLVTGVITSGIHISY